MKEQEITAKNAQAYQNKLGNIKELLVSEDNYNEGKITQTFNSLIILSQLVFEITRFLFDLNHFKDNSI